MSITIIIILITCGASLWAFNDPDVKRRMMFSPYRAVQHKEWYRVVTHALVHADFMHLFFNMYVLYVFAYTQAPGYTGLEDMYGNYFGDKGWYFFIILYVGGVFFATLPSINKHSDNDLYWSLGASGAVSAVLFSYIMMVPTNTLNFIFLPGVDIPAFVLGIAYLAYEYYMDKRGGGRIAHDAHFYGALFGIIYTIALDYHIAENFITQIQNKF